jgi:hypothetical protein
MLARIGPLIAIGRPNETIPRLGAARLYVAHDDWQATVTEHMSRSALVIIAAGKTEGLQWEVVESVRVVSPDRLIVAVPSDRTQFQAFADHFKSVLGQDVSHCFVHPPRLRQMYGLSMTLARMLGRVEFPPINGLISFEPGWQPSFHPVQATLQEMRWGVDDIYGGPLRETDWVRAIIAISFAVLFLLALFR